MDSEYPEVNGALSQVSSFYIQLYTVYHCLFCSPQVSCSLVFINLNSNKFLWFEAIWTPQLLTNCLINKLTNRHAIHKHVFMLMCVFKDTCICKCTYYHVYIDMYSCIYVYLYIYAYIYTCIYICVYIY
jgi:hypothetical protein